MYISILKCVAELTMVTVNLYNQDMPNIKGSTIPRTTPVTLPLGKDRKQVERSCKGMDTRQS